MSIRRRIAGILAGVMVVTGLPLNVLSAYAAENNEDVLLSDETVLDEQVLSNSKEVLIDNGESEDKNKSYDSLIELDGTEKANLNDVALLDIDEKNNSTYVAEGTESQKEIEEKSFIEGGEVQVYASGFTYNVDAAVKYAYANKGAKAGDGNPMECAEFVGRCLLAGGFDIVPTGRVLDVRKRIRQTGLFEEIAITDYAYPNIFSNGRISRGDVIVYMSNMDEYDDTDDDTRPPHMAFVTNVENNIVKITDRNLVNRDKNGNVISIPSSQADRQAADYSKGSKSCREGTILIYAYHYIGNSKNTSPTGHVDSLVYENGKLYVGGWAYDPDEPETSIQVNVYVDGLKNPIASFDTHIKRDIAGGVYCGFDETIDISKLGLSGKKKVSLWGIDVTGDENAEIGSATVDFSNTDNGSTPIGSIDSIGAGYGKLYVGGWAFDPDTPETSIQVNVYVEGRTNPIASFNTHIRRDIAGGINCGFDEEIDISNLGLSGKKKVSLWGIDVM